MPVTNSPEYRRILSRMGYYSYQSGLIYRHLNQSGGWDSHLKNCRNFIIRAIDHCKPEKITVLGSGWLLDLPLAEMHEKTEKINLIDIVHPPEVKEQVKDLPNVELFEDDVTGGLINEVWKKTSRYSFFRKSNSLEDIMIPSYSSENDPGLVISLNILTQLESLPLDYLRKKFKVSDEDCTLFRIKVQNSHIDFLKKHRSVLISDYSEVTTLKNGEIIPAATLLADLPEAMMREEWSWDFDKSGSDFYNSTSLMKVIALRL